ncbi:MAG: hypothetical protein HFE51_05945 [Clostridia bacterium]|nr:hypothetical protein [Clostridia bacterium]MCI9085941.1 hypothetical protein [Clostridia bacterium]
MRSKIFKKLIAGIATLAIAAQFAVVLPVSAAIGDVTTVLEAALTSAPASGEGYEWGTEFVSDISAKGLLLSNKNNTQNNYTDRGFVTFDTAKGASDSKLHITYNVAHSGTRNGKQQAYSNFTISYFNANDEFLFSITESVGGPNNKDWLNKADLTCAADGENVVNALASHLPSQVSETGSVSADVSYDGDGVGYVTIDGGTYPFKGGSSVGIKYIKLSVSGGQDFERAVNVSNYKITAEEVKPIVNRTVGFSVKGVSSSIIVADGEMIAEGDIPDITNLGYTFKGWTTDGNAVFDDSKTYIDMETLKTTPITEDVTYTAVYEKDTAYIEAITSVELVGSDLMTIGANADTAALNEYTVKITGENGTVITKENLSSNVSDFKIDWDIEGFRTVNDGEGNLFCDGYGYFGSVDSDKSSVAALTTDDVTNTFSMCKNATMNFFGKMTATVTYAGTTYEAVKYVAAICDASKPSSQILPLGGYPSNFDDYSDAFNGYASIGTTYGNEADAGDSLLGKWNMSGSDPGKKAEIVNENGNKFLRIYSVTEKKSHVLSQKITTPATQAIFEQKVRFNAATAQFVFSEKFAVWQDPKTGYKSPVSLSYADSQLSLNGTALKKDDANVTINQGVWYKVVISIDKTDYTCFAKVYDASGNLVAEADNIAWTDKTAVPEYYSVGFGNPTGTLDFDEYKAYYPTADLSTFTLTSTADTLSTKKLDETATLTASLKSKEGYDITGTVKWSILEEDTGVTLTPDETDPRKAVAAVTENAAAGPVTIQVNIGGVTKTITIEVTSSAESVRFTSSNSSISIPLDASKKEEVIYAAAVVDADGQPIAGRNVTLAVYDKDNSAAYTLPEGITFDAATGKLTITSAAKACTFTIRASGQNTDGQTISRGIKVTVHGLWFDFGDGTKESTAEGYTAITPDSAYSEKDGYGIVGTASVGGSASETNPDSDYLEGNITFKADVQPEKLYTVEVTYKAILTAEPVEGINQLGAYEIAKSDNMITATYTVPVMDNQIELIFSSGSWTVKENNVDVTHTVENAQIASIKISKQDDKTSGLKPTFFTIGDSTLSNNGSWGYYITHNVDKYADLYNVVDFQCNGRGGSNLSKYYTSGDFVNRILNAVKPGDIVMISNMGTNGGFTTDAIVNYYLDAVEALGARIVLGSYSPFGTTKDGYDASTQTFNAIRDNEEYEQTIRRIAAEREENDINYLGFVEISRNANQAFNNYVDDFAANNYASRDAAAQAIRSAFADTNHYSGLASQLIVDGYGGTPSIPGQIIKIVKDSALEVTVNSARVADNQITFEATVTGKGSAKYDAYIAEYDATTNVLVNLKKSSITLSSADTSAVVDYTRKDANSVLKAFVWDSNLKPYLTNTAVTAAE